MSNWFDPGTGDFLVVDGNIVERDALRVVEAIKDYDPDLEVLCLDPNQAGINEAPFVICERRKTDGALVRIMEAWSLDDRVLERIRLSDTARQNVLDDLVKKEEQRRLDLAKKAEEDSAENKDLVEHIVKNKKTSYTFKNDNDELVTLYEDRPHTKK